MPIDRILWLTLASLDDTSLLQLDFTFEEGR